MSRKYILMAVFSLVMLLTGCAFFEKEVEKGFSGEHAETDTTFEGIIEEINGFTAIVMADLNGFQGRVTVNLSVNREEYFKVGDRVKVTHEGYMLETDPAKINTLNVEKINK